jgi:hypothetical protein
MVRWRCAAFAVVLVPGPLVLTGMVSSAAAAPRSTTPACTDTWVGPTTGTQQWSTTSDWSSGLPSSSSVVCIKHAGTYTVQLTSSASIDALVVGGAKSGTQTLQVDGSTTDVALNLTASSEVASGGVLALDPTSSGYADIDGAGGVTINSGGALSTAGTGSAQPAYIQTPIINQSGGTVTINSPSSQQDTATLTTNQGTFKVSSTGSLQLSGDASFLNGGTLAVSGSMSQSGGDFTQSGGSETGSPVVLSSTDLIDSAGAGGFDVRGSGSLSGTIPSGQTVTVDGTSTDVALSLASVVIDDGTLSLAPTANGYADLNGAGGVSVASGGVLSTAASSGAQPAYLQTPILNQSGGKVAIGAPNTEQDEATQTTNDGTFTVSSTAALTLSGNAAFANSGTLTVSGAMSQSGGAFAQSGGSESGKPVVISDAYLVDSAGKGSFDVDGSSYLFGTIPAGQTVTVSGASTDVALDLPTAVTVQGTLSLAPTSSGYANLDGPGGVTVASGGVLSTSGVGGSEPAYIQTPVLNESGGKVTIGAPNTQQDDGTQTTNSGTIQVTNGGNLALSGDAALTNMSDGVLGVTIDATTDVASGISGPNLIAAGELSVTTVGTPKAGTAYTPIGGPVAGAFSSLSFGAHRYVVSYPSAAVQLTAEPTFTVTPVSFSATKGVATGPVEVATIGKATNGTGTYSAKVNWGDGTPSVAATVDISGSSGTVEAPTHTYAKSGTDTVTITVANTAGTTISSKESITVAAAT